MENKLINILKDLKENHNIISVKAEFEDEGTKIEEAFLLKEIAHKAGLELTIKIGGCGSLRDIFDVKTIGVTSIVSPMIESPYALKKFIETVNLVFIEQELKKINLYINIETITGYKHLEEILSLEHSKSLKGIVFGRFDMLNSMELKDKTVDCEEIFKLAQDIAQKAKKYSKEFIIGGNVSINSIDFFKRIEKNQLNKFETRKIIFDSKEIYSKIANEGILKAIDFEISWLKYKQAFCPGNFIIDPKRLAELESRYKLAISALKATI